ncbi:hypothetical protein A0J48_022695 [Sphaerospermopsis aphanizomenoides BCCUSP55]|uniref:hypothetical protein n=1 Tax=Sphaerospermopsis aphanizomenoides TaxID=459663 RepID=UPI001908420A|nr:hypothetical protein [Sphaerospermopsis aphanizomenoides]MBK1990298.1 hypothetical protein [Sphaerospermopsis aphanizomenoides BCCUSP55]
MMNSWFRFWWYWLVIAITLGLAMVGLGLVVIPDFINSVLQEIFFSTSQAQASFNEVANSYVKFFFGVLGGVMIAWSVALLFILAGPFRRGQKEAWYAVTVSILIWVIVDSSASIATGYWQNAVSNTIFLVFLGAPLVATYRDFFKS